VVAVGQSARVDAALKVGSDAVVIDVAGSAVAAVDLQ